MEDYRDQMQDALRGADADYAEIRLEGRDSTRLLYRGGEMEDAAVSSRTNGIVRACCRGGWGVSTFSSLVALKERVRDACRCAALVGRERTELADVPPAEHVLRAALRVDFRGIPLADKIALVRRYHDRARAVDRVESAIALYADTFRVVQFVSTRGMSSFEERPYAVSMVAAVARDGAMVQQAHDSVSTCADYKALTALDDRALEVGRRAAALLKAPKPEGGATTVIVDPHLGGVFVHEAFGHLSEADFLYENPRMRDLMTVGRRMGVAGLNIVDDGTVPGSVGSLGVDDEGTPARRTHLIRDGELCGHLHSLETAARMGEAPTGNARALGGECAPLVRMTNTFIEPGPLDREALFAGVDDGIYACDSNGGQTQFEMFTFAAAYGYRIRNGVVCELLRDVNLTGNVFETLHRIDGIANDFTLFQPGGGCGKGGQSPLPVAFGSPHLRIRDVVVGGGAA